jgi:hypothetical protein
LVPGSTIISMEYHLPQLLCSGGNELLFVQNLQNTVWLQLGHDFLFLDFFVENIPSKGMAASRTTKIPIRTNFLPFNKFINPPQNIWINSIVDKRDSLCQAGNTYYYEVLTTILTVVYKLAVI